jgi:hypothetical protein
MANQVKGKKDKEKLAHQIMFTATASRFRFDFKKKLIIFLCFYMVLIY